MIRKKTVFVVGAGASNEVELPLGSELLEHIAWRYRYRLRAGSAMIGDAELLKAFRELAKAEGTPLGDYIRTARDIAVAMPLEISIDNFVHTHRHDPLLPTCAKLAVVRCILHAESLSLMKPEPERRSGLDFDKLCQTWYTGLFKALHEDVLQSDLQSLLKGSLFIVFNYDRCVEHFLFHAVRTHYRLEREATAELLNRDLDICHPYGVVGRLPWQSPSGKGHSVEFGQQDSVSYTKLAGQIKTFTEGVTDPEVHNDIKRMLGNAEQVVFLGFGYHRINLEILGTSHKGPDKFVFGTARGISERNTEMKQNEVAALFANAHYLALHPEHGCASIIGEYFARLTAR